MATNRRRYVKILFTEKDILSELETCDLEDKTEPTILTTTNKDALKENSSLLPSLPVLPDVEKFPKKVAVKFKKVKKSSMMKNVKKPERKKICKEKPAPKENIMVKEIEDNQQRSNSCDSLDDSNEKEKPNQNQDFSANYISSVKESLVFDPPSIVDARIKWYLELKNISPEECNIVKNLIEQREEIIKHSCLFPAPVVSSKSRVPRKKSIKAEQKCFRFDFKSDQM